MTTLNSYAAQEALDTARNAYRSTSVGFSPIWAAFPIMCVSPSFYPLISWLIRESGQGVPLEFLPLAWLFVAAVLVVFSVVLNPSGGQRGFQQRWGIMMGVWAALYTATMAMTHFAFTDSAAAFWWAVVNPILWLVLCVVSFVWETIATKKAKEHLDG